MQTRLSVVFLLCLSAALVVMSSDRAIAKDCTQKRVAQKAPDKIVGKKNPLPAIPENISAGKKLFNHTAKPLACRQCHGTKGNGSGMMARGMEPRPRDFTCKKMMENIPDGQLFWITKNGSKNTGMMAYKALSDEEIWQLVLYIRRFVNKK